MRKTLLILATVALAIVAAPTASGAPDLKPAQPVSLQILSVSDWHAQLEPVSGVGGAAALSAYFAADRAANPNTLTLTAGDAYGASPPISSFNEERPAVLAMRMMGFDADTFGNHNFDRGVAHLQQMVHLANAPQAQPSGSPSATRRRTSRTWTRIFRGGQMGLVQGRGSEGRRDRDHERGGSGGREAGSLGTIEITDSVEAVNKWAAVTRNAGATS